MPTMPDLKSAAYERIRPTHTPLHVPIPLADLRNLLGLTIRELANALPPQSNGKPWSKSHLGYVESGQRLPSPDLIASILHLIRTWSPLQVGARANDE